MDIGAESPHSGKHRLDADAAVWLPMGGELDHAPSVHARPLIAPGDVPVQRGRAVLGPLSDTDSVGLRTFDIGLVPASVTPPTTWKRAAWFAVLSAAGVLIGLTIAAAKLVGGTGQMDRIGLPGYPAGVPLLTGLTTKEPTSPLVEVRTPSTTLSVRQTGGVPTDSGPNTSDDANRTPSGTSTSGPDATPPQVTTVPNPETPIVDTAAIVARTEKFYEEVAANTDTALAMTTEAFRSTGEALLEQRFSDVSLIVVREISVDPVKGITVSMLQVTKKDGSISTEQRELTFTTAGDPLINAERLTGIG